MASVGGRAVLLLRRFGRENGTRLPFLSAMSMLDAKDNETWAGPAGRRLSPAYDLNPVPTDLKPRVLSTAIDLEDGTASLKLAFDVCEYFELGMKEAQRIAAEVGKAVTGWRKVAA